MASPKRLAFLVFPRLTLLDPDRRLRRPLVSVCSGALLLGRAGYLRDKRGATHRMTIDLLPPLCREALANRRITIAKRMEYHGHSPA